jgi:hypothetical protein
MPPEQRAQLLSQSGATAAERKPTLTPQALGGASQIMSTPAFGGAATVVPGSVAQQQPFSPAVMDQKGLIAAAGRSSVNVKLPPQQDAFESETGKIQAKAVGETKIAAQDAANIIETVNNGRDLLTSGMITGAGAEFLTSLNQALKTVGVDLGYADAATNSQAYAANMAQNVGRIIKQFGAGTGLSDADREYAEKMAAGKINLNENALRKILDINEKAARNVISIHNKSVEGIKSIVPLKVKMPDIYGEKVKPSGGADIESLLNKYK